LGGRRFISSSTQAGALGEFASERAPLTSKVRRYGLPRLLMPPRV
jgi:hypothetical protein